VKAVAGIDTRDAAFTPTADNAAVWRWTSAVWPSKPANPCHIVHFGSPRAVCGARATRIDGERWFARDFTDRSKCSKCAAWEAKQPPRSPQ